MGKHPTRRGYFLTAMTGSLIGLLVGALLVSVIPAVAGNGDPMVLGARNRAGRSTWLASQGPSVLKLNNTAGGVVLDLRNGGGAAPMAVDSDRRVARFNADEVDGRHARDLIRVAYGSTDDAADADGAAVTVTISAPRPGLLVMSGAIDAYGNTYDAYRCRLKVDDTTVTDTQMTSVVHNAGGAHTNNASEDCSTTGVQPVAAGSYDVTLDITDWNTLAFYNASLWAMYVPFDGNGNPPDIP